MGRWAQRQRGGGGGAGTNFIVSAHKSGVDTVEVTYQQAIAIGNLIADTFVSDPSNEVGTVLTQVSAKVIEVDFDINISTDTTLSYVGENPNVKHPQTVAYT